MKLTFASGTTRQQTQWRQALDRLISLPTSAIPLQIEVSFVDPAELVTGHATDLAITTWTYGSTSATTKVRNDAPGYGSQRQTLEALAAKMGLEYNADLHFNETAVHETAHALYAALPQEVRIEIAEMFGAKSDSLAELQPIGVAWEDQIIEGIAETFKEAFLPRRFRVFPNRTNRSIPYERFPEFRKLFRDAMPETGGGELAPGEKETPGYNLDIFAQGEPTFSGWSNPIPGAGGKKGLWQYSFGNLESGPGLHNAQGVANSEWEGWVKDGTVLTYSFLLPLGVFDASIIGAPYIEPASPLQSVNDCGYQWQVFTRKKLGALEEFIHHAVWSRTAITQKQFEEQESTIAEWVSGWILYYEARGGGLPPLTFSRSIVVNSTNFTETLKCGGETYRRVWIFGQLATNFTAQYPETVAEEERLRAATFYQFLPSLMFVQAACTGGGEKGSAVILPTAELTPHGFSRGAHPTRRPTAGSLH